jgi:hypothetical protein
MVRLGNLEPKWIENISCSSTIHPLSSLLVHSVWLCLPCFPKLTVQVYLLISWKILSTLTGLLATWVCGFSWREREREREMGVENSLVTTKPFVR